MKPIFKLSKLIIVLLCTTLLIASCEDDTNNLESSSENILINKTGPELAFPNQKGTIETINYFGKPLQVVKIGEHYVAEGDMIVRPDEKVISSKSTGRSLASSRWPNNTIYYEIQSDLPNQQRIMDAMDAWKSIAPIRFEVRTDQEDYVFFKTGGGCSANIGREGGRQEVTLNDRCTTGMTMHEIGHALGLYHEQSRADRDETVTINFENITEGAQANFQTNVALGFGFDDAVYTEDLDINSIMMYGSFFFSKNGLPTIVRKDGSTFEANRSFLSDGDIIGINKMYPESNPGGICVGIEEFVGGEAYQPGDRVTYLGNLFERTADGWVFIEGCEASNGASVKSGSFKHLNDYKI